MRFRQPFRQAIGVARAAVDAVDGDGNRAYGPFSAARNVGANAVVVGAWDYKHLAGTAASDRSSLDIGELPALEVYDGSGA